MQLIISENTMCFKGKRHHMVSSEGFNHLPLQRPDLCTIVCDSVWTFLIPVPRSLESRCTSLGQNQQVTPFQQTRRRTGTTLSMKVDWGAAPPPLQRHPGSVSHRPVFKAEFLKCCWRLQSQQLLLHTESNIFLSSCSLPTEGLYFHFNCSCKTKQRCYWY